MHSRINGKLTTEVAYAKGGNGNGLREMKINLKKRRMLYGTVMTLHNKPNNVINMINLML